MLRNALLVSLVSATLSVIALAQDAPEDAEDARRARVVATIGETVITVGDLEDKINARSAYARKRFQDPAIVREYADNQINAALLEQGAERLGYADDPEVSAFINRSIVQLFMREEIEGAKPIESITDEQVETYYNEHPDEFRRPEMRRASHILVASRDEAKKIIAELEGGANKTFAAMAKQTSLDTETKLRGGDLLYFTADGGSVGSNDDARVDEKLVKAAFSVKGANQLAKRPIDMGDGKWSVVMVTAVRPARVESLADASGGIRRRMWREDRKNALETLVTDVRKEVGPTTYPERMDAIVLEATTKPIDPPNQ